MKTLLLLLSAITVATALPAQRTRPIVSGLRVSGPNPAIYTYNGTTVLGCECKTECNTGALFHCNTATYCLVKSSHCKKGTADYSYTNADYYDYCTWPEDMSYESLSAEAKHKLLTSHILKDTASGKYPSGVGLLGIFTESVRLTMRSSSDIFPMTRTKYIHSVGAIAAFKLVPAKGQRYSGLFSGSQFGFVRASCAVAPSAKGITPGVGIKMMRDGRPSANFVAMPSLDDQASMNFFLKNFSNHVGGGDSLQKKLLASKFWQASFCPKMVGLSDVAASGEDGLAVESAAFPWRISLQPRVAVQVPNGDWSAGIKNFQAIASGTALFDVWADATPRSGAPELIGHMETTSTFTPSKFADEEMFFKHQLMEDDFALQPSWLSQIDKADLCGMSCAGPKPPRIDQGCTSPFNPPPAPPKGSKLLRMAAFSKAFATK